MKEKFLTKIRAIAVVAMMFSTVAVSAKGITVSGKVLCEGKGVAGVVVSDGVNVVKTDANGAYTMLSDVDLSKFVHISIPGGYEVECNGYLPQFYARLDKSMTAPQTFDFKLKKVDQSAYTVVTISDSHVTGPNNSRSCHLDRERYLTQLIPAINEYVATQKVATYVMSCGDMTQAGYRPQEKNEYKGYSLENYIEDTKISVPLFNALGNHDHNNAPKGTVLTDSTIGYSRIDYVKACGPDYYSINIGREHYVFIDNTFVLTKESSPTYKEGATSGYQVRLDDQQQAWLEKDMAMVDKSKIDRVVVVAHCQTLNNYGGLKMMRAKKFFDAFKGYDVVLFTGHAHCDNIVKTTINGQTVIEYTNPSAAGTAWYTPWNCDGSPGAAVAYKFKSGEKPIDREYVTYGEIKEKGYKYRVYDNVNHKWNYPITESTCGGWSRQHDLQKAHYKDRPAIIVNVWSAYSIEFFESTGGQGEVKKGVYDLNYRDWYWNYYERSLNNEFPEGETLRKAAWQTPSTGGNNVVMYIPADAKAVVTVKAKDVYGRVIAEFTAQAAL